MAHLFLHLQDLSTLLRTGIDTISTFNILYDLKVAYRTISKKGCIQEQQQEMLVQNSIRRTFSGQDTLLRPEDMKSYLPRWPDA
jgi:hypothetical protein